MQAPGDDTFCIVVGHRTARAGNLIDTRRWDVVRADWLEQCVRAQRWTPPPRRAMIHATPATLALLAELADPLGDSFLDDATEAAFRCRPIAQSHA